METSVSAAPLRSRIFVRIARPGMYLLASHPEMTAPSWSGGSSGALGLQIVAISRLRRGRLGKRAVGPQKRE